MVELRRIGPEIDEKRRDAKRFRLRSKKRDRRRRRRHGDICLEIRIKAASEDAEVGGGDHSDGCGDQSLLRSHSCCRQIRRWNRQENLQSRERRVFETGKNSDDVRQRAKSEHAAENHRGRREPEPARAGAAIRHGERDERNRNEA